MKFTISFLLYQLLIFISRTIYMFSQLQAQTNLRSISQKTNYLQDWAQHPPLNKYIRNSRKQIIIEESYQQPKTESPSKRIQDIIKHHYQKYGVKRSIKRQQTINQIYYPVLDKNLLLFDQKHLNNNKQYPNSNGYKRKLCRNGKVIRIIDTDFTKNKLQTFQKKHYQSQKDLNSQLVKEKMKDIPMSVKFKRSQNHCKRTVGVNNEELETIKRLVSKNSKRFSVPLINSRKLTSNSEGIDQFFHDI